MPRTRARPPRSLYEQFPPSPPCSCKVCLSYCIRPGWWTVEEADAAIKAGYAPRMMLEVAPERTFGVISPAFQGCEGSFALQEFSKSGCTFLKENLCELHGTGLQPLECRFCHHDRVGEGPLCHARLEQDWHTPAGRLVVTRWVRLMGLIPLLQRYNLQKII